MGLFNRKKKEVAPMYAPNYQRPPFEINYQIDKDGRLMIEYIDHENKVGKMYDTTRLIYTNKFETLGKKQVPDFLVSWYGQDDAVLLNGSGEFGRRTDYSEILADIDIKLMQTDQQYCATVMKNLLNENRIETYLGRGLEDSPKYPCGRYVGGVRIVQGVYDKFFNVDKGRDAHYKPYMVKMREEYKAKQKIRKQNQIARNNTEIRRLEEENDRLSR